MKNKSVFATAMEAHLDGKPHIEREITAYVKLRDLYDITSIADSSETHEQWQVPLQTKKANARIRLTDNVEYSYTIKEKSEIVFECIESEQKIEAAFFEVLKRSAAINGYLKTRYNIDIPESNRKWEVDVFKKYSGEPSLWVKLDYEFGEDETKLPEIPFDYDEIIIPDIEDGRDEDVTRLWEEEWAKLDEDKS